MRTSSTTFGYISGGWFNIGCDSCMNKWHVTVFYHADGLRLGILCATQSQTKKLCKLDDSVMCGIVKAAATCKMGLLCRQAWYANPDSPFKGQKIGRVDDSFILTPHAVSSSLRPTLARTLRATLADMSASKLSRTELQAFKLIPRSDLLGRGAAAQVKLVAKTIMGARKVLDKLLET